MSALGSTIQFQSSAIGRFTVNDPTTVTSNSVLGSFQSASTSFNLQRAYYQMNRLLAYVYVVGGNAPAHLAADGVTVVPAGPTDVVERHQQ